MSRRSRYTLRIAVSILIILAILALVVLSPLWLRTFSAFPHMNWSELSNVGQTYGAVSAILSALALIGVSFSVLFQTREARFSRLEANRTRHYDLVRLALENPTYSEIFGLPHDVPIETSRGIAFINLSLQFWQMMWEFSDMSENELRFVATNLFNTSLGRDYWQRYGQTRLRNDNTKKEREFDATIDSVYRVAVAGGPPVDVAANPASVAANPGSMDHFQRTENFNKLVEMTVTLVGGITIGHFLHVVKRRFRP